MDLRSLTYFVEVAESQSFSRAAAKLNRTQPALSRCITDLEADLGFKLFERMGRKIAITAHGKVMLEQIKVVLAHVEAVRERAQLLATGKTSVLRVGSTVNLIERIFPEILRQYRAKWPHVEVSLKPEGASALLASIEKADIDIAITRHLGGRFLTSRLAFPTYVIAVLPTGHRLSNKTWLDIKELAGERLLTAPTSAASRMLLDSAFLSAHIRPWIAFENHELSALVALAEVGQGIAIVPSSADTKRYSVRPLPVIVGGAPLVGWTSLVWDQRRKLPDYAQGFIDIALRHLKTNYPGRELKIPRPFKKQRSKAGE